MTMLDRLSESFTSKGVKEKMQKAWEGAKGYKKDEICFSFSVPFVEMENYPYVRYGDDPKGYGRWWWQQKKLRNLKKENQGVIRV